MRVVSLSEGKENLGKLVDLVKKRGRVIAIGDNKQAEVLLVPIPNSQVVAELIEDIEDNWAIEERKNEPLLPFEEVFPKKKQK